MRKFVKRLGKSDDLPDAYVIFVDTSNENNADETVVGIATSAVDDKICTTRKKWRTILIDYGQSFASRVPHVSNYKKKNDQKCRLYFNIEMLYNILILN